MKHIPRTLEVQRTMNREQLAQRVKMGDHLDLPREVEHAGVFSQRAWAVRAATELTGLGYRTSVARRGFKFELLVHHLSTLDDETVEHFVDEVYEVMERNHGAYSGWGGPFARE